eukprot:TRINITY_DN4914_c0_g1_i2.p1 TRINITY_DN4914_c0_g1~~TRINITY_DN4914_c0_g1_i2.p1  ORF type:complete len:1034 (+),score=205.93 TRINITY_DN4914_c0_g1_i2:104-3205(+)
MLENFCVGTKMRKISFLFLVIFVSLHFIGTNAITKHNFGIGSRAISLLASNSAVFQLTINAEPPVISSMSVQVYCIENKYLGSELPQVAHLFRASNIVDWKAVVWCQKAGDTVLVKTDITSTTGNNDYYITIAELTSDEMNDVIIVSSGDIIASAPYERIIGMRVSSGSHYAGYFLTSNVTTDPPLYFYNKDRVFSESGNNFAILPPKELFNDTLYRFIPADTPDYTANTNGSSFYVFQDGESKVPTRDGSVTYFGIPPQNIYSDNVMLLHDSDGNQLLSRRYDSRPFPSGSWIRYPILPIPSEGSGVVSFRYDGYIQIDLSSATVYSYGGDLLLQLSQDQASGVVKRENRDDPNIFEYYGVYDGPFKVYLKVPGNTASPLKRFKFLSHQISGPATNLTIENNDVEEIWIREEPTEEIAVFLRPTNAKLDVYYPREGGVLELMTNTYPFHLIGPNLPIFIKATPMNASPITISFEVDQHLYALSMGETKDFTETSYFSVTLTINPSDDCFSFRTPYSTTLSVYDDHRYSDYWQIKSQIVGDIVYCKKDISKDTRDQMIILISGQNPYGSFDFELRSLNPIVTWNLYDPYEITAANIGTSILKFETADYSTLWVQSTAPQSIDFISNSRIVNAASGSQKRQSTNAFLKGDTPDTSRIDFALVRIITNEVATFSVVGVKGLRFIPTGQGNGGGFTTFPPPRTSSTFTKPSKTSARVTSFQTTLISFSSTSVIPTEGSSAVTPTRTNPNPIIPVKNVTDALADPKAKISKDDAKLFLESIGEQRQELNKDKFFSTVELIASALLRNTTTAVTVESSTISIAVTPVSSNQSINFGFTSSRSEAFVPQEVLEVAIVGASAKAIFSSYEFNPFESIDKTELFAYVVSLAFFDVNNDKIEIKNASKPIVITIPYNSVPSNGNFSCLFWDEKQSLWDSTGCTPSQDDIKRVVLCSCTHLTNFSLGSTAKNEPALQVPNNSDSTRILPLAVGIGGGVALLIIVGVIVAIVVVRKRRGRYSKQSGDIEMDVEVQINGNQIQLG